MKVGDMVNYQAMLSLKEAAVHLGIEQETLRKWVQRRLIPHYRYPLPTSRPRFKKTDLDRFIDSHRLDMRRVWPMRSVV